jgi:hypothetical protein
MGHDADDRRPASYDDLGSYGNDDSEAKVTGLVTGTLRRPPRGNEIRGGPSSQEAARRLAAHRFAVASRSATEPARPETAGKTLRGPALTGQARQETLGLQ